MNKIRTNMNWLLLPLLAAALLLPVSGCSSSTTTDSSGQTATPAQTVTQAATTTGTAPASASTATVKMTGAITRTSTVEAFCGAYYPAQNKGTLFEAYASGAAGWKLAVGDTEHRVEGPQSSIDWGILNDNQTGSYTMVIDGAQVVFGPGLKSATVKARFQEVTHPDSIINVDASFNCE